MTDRHPKSKVRMTEWLAKFPTKNEGGAGYTLK